VSGWYYRSMLPEFTGCASAICQRVNPSARVQRNEPD
jgi:hypothetical protein